MRRSARWGLLIVPPAAFLLAAAPSAPPPAPRTVSQPAPFAPRGVTAASLLPPLTDASLPPLPAASARNANYTIEARLDPDAHTLDGTLDLRWRNVSRVTVQAFPFHLYWNAFRNSLSASARGEGRRAARASRREADRGWGYVDVTAVKFIGRNETDLLPTLRYLPALDTGAPGAGATNTDDRTVMEVTAPFAVPPGGEAHFRISWHARIPYGDVGRAGWVHDYHFMAQWFPKVGVIQDGVWNAHAFYPWTEFYADFGVYDVRLTLPRGFVVGATGRLQEKKENADGSETFRFVQEDVHDFTWTASRRYLDVQGRFEDPGYPPVALRLLLQPEHAHLAERYLEATRIALRSYGAWSAPYPYPQITVVDPAWNSAAGGMEYSTLFTGGAFIWAPPELQAPESVTVHECGHQFWFALVANNEFEQAWLDEGFNTYHENKATDLFLGPVGWGRRYFGVHTPNRGPRGGWPVVAPGVQIGRGMGDLSALRRSGESDDMNRAGWNYRNADAYTLNSYGKPGLTLQTLENLVGDATMTRIMRTYGRRWRFRHPTSQDFIAVVKEVTGRDWSWYFDQVWFGSGLCDYSVSAKSEAPRQPEGFVEGEQGRLTFVRAPEKPDEAKAYDSVVEVRRLGAVQMPVEVLVQFADGSERRESWDGRYRWTRFRYTGQPAVKRAVVDPEGKLALDVNPANNSWVKDTGQARRAATKWGARWMFWLQNLLEMHMVAL
jgi:hypothetical protein